ncbi:MAG: pilus assembly protein [Actinobacteria bacterium]|nr:pilus assembly protein [Actinomycetota bacterium]
MHTIRRQKSITDERGQTATELALVLPVFCLLLFGVIQFGILFKNYVTLTDAVRAGARTAAVSRLETSPEGVVDAAVRRSASGLDQPCSATGLCVTVTAPKWERGEDVTVEARYPYEINLLGFVAAEGYLTSKTTERVE